MIIVTTTVILIFIAIIAVSYDYCSNDRVLSIYILATKGG